jgi:hypothetical protein
MPLLILVMAHYRLGNLSEAGRLLNQGVRSMDWSDAEATDADVWVRHAPPLKRKELLRRGRKRNRKETKIQHSLRPRCVHPSPRQHIAKRSCHHFKMISRTCIVRFFDLCEMTEERYICFLGAAYH